jgi:hypothetical protein
MLPKNKKKSLQHHSSPFSPFHEKTVKFVQNPFGFSTFQQNVEFTGQSILVPYSKLWKRWRHQVLTSRMADRVQEMST